MKKIIRISAMLAFMAIPALCQAQAFTDGTNLVSIGFGLPPGERIEKTLYVKENYTDYRLKNYGTVILKYEHGLHEHFGLGLNLEYSGASASYKYDHISSLRNEVKSKSNVFGFFARMNGHVPIGESFDIYGGVGLGYLYTITTNTDTNPFTEIDHKSKVLDFDYQLGIGLRYMVKESIGLFFEVGRGTTISQLGIALKF